MFTSLTTSLTFSDVTFSQSFHHFHLSTRVHPSISRVSPER